MASVCCVCGNCCCCWWWLCVNEIARKSCRPLADPCLTASRLACSFGCDFLTDEGGARFLIESSWRISRLLWTHFRSCWKAALVCTSWLSVGATMNKCLSFIFLRRKYFLKKKKTFKVQITAPLRRESKRSCVTNWSISTRKAGK